MVSKSYQFPHTVSATGFLICSVLFLSLHDLHLLMKRYDFPEGAYYKYYSSTISLLQNFSGVF